MVEFKSIVYDALDFLGLSESHVSYDFFFFQAEDGIRDLTVTGVQTCALPISAHDAIVRPACRMAERPDGERDRERVAGVDGGEKADGGDAQADGVARERARIEIGRASCRERV